LDPPSAIKPRELYRIGARGAAHLTAEVTLTGASGCERTPDSFVVETEVVETEFGLIHANCMWEFTETKLSSIRVY
jgi:hypothetical protein